MMSLVMNEKPKWRKLRVTVQKSNDFYAWPFLWSYFCIGAMFCRLQNSCNNTASGTMVHDQNLLMIVYIVATSNLYHLKLTKISHSTFKFLI